MPERTDVAGTPGAAAAPADPAEGVADLRERDLVTGERRSAEDEDVESGRTGAASPIGVSVGGSAMGDNERGL